MSKAELVDICRYRTDSMPVDPQTYISTESMLPNRAGVTAASSIPSTGKARVFRKGDTLVSNIRPYFKKIWQATADGCCSADVLVFEPSNCDADYLYWLLSDDSFFDYMVATSKGTKMPRGDKAAIVHFEFERMDNKDQVAIANALNPIRELININQQTNDYLLESARSLYAHWFEDYRYWGGSRPRNWASCALGEHVAIKRGGSPRPIHEYLSDEGCRWLKISDVTSEPSPYILSIKEHIRPEGINKTVHLNAGSLVLSNSATPGIPKILDLDTCIHDGWLYFPSSELSNEWLFLYFMSQRERLVSLANGSVFKNLKIDIVKNFDLVMPDNNTLNSFQELVQPLFESMLNNARENRRLAELRDVLLPRLMSGGIDVSAIE